MDHIWPFYFQEILSNGHQLRPKTIETYIIEAAEFKYEVRSGPGLKTQLH